MTTNDATPAFEIARLLGRATVCASQGQQMDSTLQSLMTQLIQARASTPEDALALSVWTHVLLREVQLRLADGMVGPEDLQLMAGIGTALVGRTIDALEAATGVPSATFYGADRFRQ